MKPFMEIETSRLKLRPSDLKDAEAIFEQYAQDSEVTRYLTWQPHKIIDTTMEFLRRCSDEWEHESAFAYVVIRKQDQQLIGMIEIRVDGHRADIGYVFARAYWGHGYATEAVSSLVEWAMNQPYMYRVWAVCDIDNHASARVLEKVGMQREGILRRFLVHPTIAGEPRDCYCYSLVK